MIDNLSGKQFEARKLPQEKPQVLPYDLIPQEPQPEKQYEGVINENALKELPDPVLSDEDKEKTKDPFVPKNRQGDTIN